MQASLFIPIDNAVRIVWSLELLSKQLRKEYKTMAEVVLGIFRHHLVNWNIREEHGHYRVRVLECPKADVIIARPGIKIPIHTVCNLFLLVEMEVTYTQKFTEILKTSFSKCDLMRIRSYLIRYQMAAI